MASLPHSGDILQTVHTLAERIGRIERARRPAWKQIISSGVPALDRMLPAGGLHRGTLVEWLAVGPGSGAAALALRATRQAARAGGAVVVIDRHQRFYPPAAIHLGIKAQQLIVVRPASAADLAWAFDQALAARGVAAVWGEPGSQDDHTLRRWQLAAESSGALGLLLRGESARHEPSWAEMRLLVEPIAGQRADRNRRLRVELLRSRTGCVGGAIELEISGHADLQEEPSTGQEQVARRRGLKYETRDVHLASPVAATEIESGSKSRRRRRRA
jgi:protein ImuA